MVKHKIEMMVSIQLTPFKKNGEVDEASYRRLVNYMLNNGARAL
jgi:dihydrodipicolinate synthase/N-acetylneuraminate lyase